MLIHRVSNQDLKLDCFVTSPLSKRHSLQQLHLQFSEYLTCLNKLPPTNEAQSG